MGLDDIHNVVSALYTVETPPPPPSSAGRGVSAQALQAQALSQAQDTVAPLGVDTRLESDLWALLDPLKVCERKRKVLELGAEHLRPDGNYTLDGTT
jgi:hypothetical protein